MFVWHRDTPVAWAETLTRLYPPQAKTQHLVCWWEPGMPKRSIQRWMIYAGIPEALAPSEAVAIRESPQSSRRNQRMLRFLEEHGCVAVEAWVIQGPDGGHPRFFSPEESQHDAAHGGSGTPPEPGSLPYADFDAKTLAGLRTLDLFCQPGLSLKECYEGRTRDLERQTRAALLERTTRGMADAVEDAMPSLQTMDLPQWERGDPLMDRDWDEVEEHYIKTGHLLNG